MSAIPTSHVAAFLAVFALASAGCPGSGTIVPTPGDTAANDQVTPDSTVDTPANPDVPADSAAPDADAAVDVTSDSTPDALADLPADVPTDTPTVDVPAPDVTLKYNCSELAQGPFKLTKMDGPIASEDLAFDDVGNLIGSNDNAIFRSSYTPGASPQVWVPNLQFRAGMRMLPNGHLVVCDNTKGELVRVDEDGVKHTMVTGLSYPNGITVDLAGWVYFTEHDGNVVWRVNPFTGDKTILTTKIGNPNGLTFSPDYSTLYIGGFNGNPNIHAMSISPDGVPGKLVVFATVGTGWHDGMAVDACGNVYIADYSTTQIWRITPDGQDATMIIDASGLANAYLPNLQWGSGIGGWNPMALYLPDGWNKGVFEVNIGVPGKPVAFP